MSKKSINNDAKIIIETFKKLGTYESISFKRETPSCFNGNVSFKKYRITIELIEEPIEVYHKRLQDMWDVCDNHHHWQPLKQAADSVGYKMVGFAGGKRQKK